MKKIKNIIDFEELLQDHDWFYAFSDDRRYYKVGKAKEEMIVAITAENRWWRDLYMVYSEYNSPLSKMTEEEFMAKRSAVMEGYLAYLGN